MYLGMKYNQLEHDGLVCFGNIPGDLPEEDKIIKRDETIKCGLTFFKL